MNRLARGTLWMPNSSGPLQGRLAASESCDPALHRQCCQEEEWPMLSPAVDDPERPENGFLGPGRARRPESKRIIQNEHICWLQWSMPTETLADFGCVCDETPILYTVWLSQALGSLLYAGPFPELAQSLGMYFCWIKNLKNIYLAKNLALSNELNGSPTSDSARHPRPPMAVSGIFVERLCSFWDPFWVRAHFHKIWPMESPKCLLPAYPTHLCSARPGAVKLPNSLGSVPTCLAVCPEPNSVARTVSSRVFIPCQSHPHLSIFCI